jgi:cobalt-zinc-cadmium efflux system outer membrane protein
MRWAALAALLLAWFGVDPRIVRAEALSLDQAVQATLAQNPELKSMQQDAEAAKSAAKKSRYWDDPLVGVRFYQVPIGANLDQATDIDYIAAQKFPFPGKVKAASEIAHHNYLHHLEDLDGRGRELLKELKSAYYQLFAAERLLEVSRSLEGKLRGMVQGAQAKLAAGEPAAADAVQGQAELAKLLAERETLKQRRQVWQAKLNQLMYRPLDQAIQLPAKLPPPRWDLSLAELEKIAELRHPKLKGARHRIEEKTWGVKAAKRDWYPDFGAQVEYVQRPGQTEDAWTGELMMNVPLIVGKKKAAVKQAEAELAGARYTEQATKNDVGFRVQEIYQKMRASERILQVTGGTLLPQVRQSLEVTNAAYLAGKSYFLDSLNAARGLLQAQNDYWKAYAELAEAGAELEEAVGMTIEEWRSQGRNEP